MTRITVRVGFSGTREGMTYRQRMEFRDWLMTEKPDELHHGDCVGADAEADEIARSLGVRIVVHPPDEAKFRAFCGRPGDKVCDPAPYLVRNHDIVDETETLFAAPLSPNEAIRSGTWATIRYARELGRRVVIA